MSGPRRRILPAVTAALFLAACAQETGPITAETNPTSTESPTTAPDLAGRSTNGDDGAEQTWEPGINLPGATGAEEEPDGAVEVTVGAIGDILSHAPVIANANRNAGGEPGEYDFSPMFAEVADLIAQPDITICHMETPISADNTNLTVPRTLVFNTPREIADALAGAGVDGCDFASNHTMDQGLEGLRETQEVIEGAGMKYAGPVGEESRAGETTVYDVDGVQVAHLAFTYTYPNSGVPTTSVPEPWLEQYLWPAIGAEGILEQAAAAKEAGADFVVVSMHWGNEYQTEPTSEQTELAEALLSSDDVDLIIGGHVHVIQPCETINGKVVAYGLGNFLSNQSPDTTRGGLRKATQEGMVAHFTLKRAEDGTVTSSMAYQPTRVDLEGHVVRPATPETHPETYERTVETMDLLGEDACGAEPLS